MSKQRFGHGPMKGDRGISWERRTWAAVACDRRGGLHRRGELHTLTRLGSLKLTMTTIPERITNNPKRISLRKDGLTR